LIDLTWNGPIFIPANYQSIDILTHPKRTLPIQRTGGRFSR